MSHIASETIDEPETLLSEQEWLEAKRIALQLVRGDQLDGPEAHLAYVRQRIRAALGGDVV